MINVQPKTTQLVREGHYSSFKASHYMVHQKQIKCLNSTPFSSNNTDECITQITKNEA